MPVSEERIRELLDHEEPDYAAAAAEVGVEGLLVLAPMILSADELLAAQAASLAAVIAGDPPAAPATLPLLATAALHREPSVRATAALGAARVGAAALTLIESLLADEDPGVRRFALQALVPPLPPPILAAAQQRAAEDPDPGVRDKAAGLVARSPETTLGDELLAGVLEYAYRRLVELRDAVLTGVGVFATAAGVPGFVDAGGAVAERLAAARAALDLVPPRIEANDFGGAAIGLGAALRVVAEAATLVGGASLTQLLGGQIRWTAAVPRGLARQLGLPAALPALTVAGGVLGYVLSAPGRVLTPAPLRLGFERAELGARLRLDGGGPGGAPALSVSLALFGVEAGVGGEPISSLLGGARGSARSDIVIGVDTERGLTLGGGSGARAVLPATSTNGALDLREVVLELPQGVPGRIDLGTTIVAAIGDVIRATIDGMGLHLHLDPAAVLGGGDPLSVSAKPPTGIGLTLDTGLVRGGGYLGRRSGGYGGALQLRLGPVEVRAAGLLTLEPFALVVVMSVEFTPPIDLSFGFTLNAVGGVIGVEHRLDTDALRAGISSGALDHILFPPDPVAAAPVILSTLEHLFPVDRGSVVIGPMVEIGWGRPVSFLTAQLGVILSLPDPGIVIVGRVRIALPAPQLPIVDLRAAVYGEVTPDHLLIRVSLNGSRIATFPVSGDIGLLLRWGGSPEFAVSAGGFHPRYAPPPELTGMRRLSMDLSPPAVLSLRAESYVALTSSTVQLGSRVEMGADLGVASISGHFGFDALVVFAPRFGFVVQVSIGLTVRALGVTLLGVHIELNLEGPAPWRAEGRAEVEILWTTVPIQVGPFTWGDRENPPPPLADPRRLVHQALHRNPGAWQALQPPDSDRVVRLAAAPPSEVDVTVHPMGLFDVRQHAIPLETVIARVGASPVPEGQRRVHLGVPLVNGMPAGALSEVTDLFAAGTYLDLPDDQKLSRPGFEPMPAGARIRPPGETADLGRARQAELRYETFVCDESGTRGKHSRAAADRLVMTSPMVALAAGSTGRSELRATTRYAAEPDPIVLADAGEVVAVSKTTVTAEAPGTWATYTHAAETALAADAQLARLGVV